MSLLSPSFWSMLWMDMEWWNKTGFPSSTWRHCSIVLEQSLLMKNLMPVWFSFLYNWPLLSLKELSRPSLNPWCSEISQCHIETWIFFSLFLRGTWDTHLVEKLFSFIFEKNLVFSGGSDVLSICSIISF